MARLTSDDLLEIARRVVGAHAAIRDEGLLHAALARVEARTPAGAEVYRSVEERAAALLHSLATTAPLVRGSLPFSWAATAVYLARNGRRSPLDDGQAVALVTDVATGKLESVQDIAARLSPSGEAA